MNRTVVSARIAAIAAAVLASAFASPAAILQPGGDLPYALAQMAETERAFARRARETTVRQAFIDFFADEAVGFGPDPEPARDALRRQTTPQPPGFELHWEPRLGDVSASGDLGYLTGPAEYINPGKPNRYSCYFSVWKRLPDGQFRVILDIGANTPAKTPFAPGMVRSPAFATWKGQEPRERAEATLRAADEALAASIAARGASAAFAAVMPAAGRMYRNDVQPMTRADAVAWLAREVTAMTSTPMKAETAAAGDLGYTWGRHTTTRSSGAVSSYYLRVWTRRGDGVWQLVADITTPPPPSR